MTDWLGAGNEDCLKDVTYETPEPVVHMIQKIVNADGLKDVTYEKPKLVATVCMMVNADGLKDVTYVKPELVATVCMKVNADGLKDVTYEKPEPVVCMVPEIVYADVLKDITYEKPPREPEFWMTQDCSINADGLKDETFKTPEPVAQRDPKFDIQDKVNAVKEVVEGETDEEYSTFTATYFLKRDFNYKIKVDIGDGQCVHLDMTKDTLMDVKKCSINTPLEF